MLKHFVAAVMSLGLLSACQGAQPNIPQNKGALRITVQFPKSDFATKLIRPETRVIYVAVYGANAASAPQIFGPITPRNPQVRLSQLTAGQQTIVAAAYDEQKQILTAGRSLALVKANDLSQASLELEADYSQKLAADQLKLLQGLQIQLPALNAQLVTDLQPSQILNPNPPMNVPVTEGLDVNTGARSESAPDAGQALKANATPAPVSSSASSFNYQPVQNQAVQPQQVQSETVQIQATPEPTAEPTVSEPAPAAEATPMPAAAPTNASSAEADKAQKEKEAKEKQEKAEKEAEAKKEEEEKRKKGKRDRDHSGHGHGDDDDDDRRGHGDGDDD